MKYKLDFCRIQWLNREFLPLDYAFKYNKNESRFTRIFNSDSKHNNNKNDNIIKEQIKNTNNVEDSSLILRIQSNQNDIDIRKLLKREEMRKTLMIKNIPNKFTIEDFLKIFSDFNEKFNLFLIPTDIKRKKNYGYAYINFLDSLDIIYFYYRFNGKKWPNTNSIKICEIIYSKIQGNTKIIKHFPFKTIYNKIINQNENKKYIIIPLCYLNIFKEIYPNIEINVKNIYADIFLAEKNIFENNNSNINSKNNNKIHV
jgi:hypothetical protein